MEFLVRVNSQNHVDSHSHYQTQVGSQTHYQTQVGSQTQVGYQTQVGSQTQVGYVSTFKGSESFYDINEVGISTIKHGGRLPGIYKYDIIEHNGKSYAIVSIQHKKSDIKFVIDHCNLSIVLNRPWHLSSGKYIATNYTLEDGTNKELYLHNFIKENCMNEFHKSIIHINNNMMDNRSENLRLVVSTEHINQKEGRKRTVVLPDNCGFTVDDIPKYVSFTKASGEHGDRFVIEIPKLSISRKLTSSKKIPIEDKFKEVKKLLEEIYVAYPELTPGADDSTKKELNESFDAILKGI